jgi:hypothetical protein
VSVRSFLLVSAAWLIACWTPAFGLVERIEEKTFPATPGTTLKVETYHGSITVSLGDSPQIRIVIRKSIDVADDRAADRILEDLDLKAEKTGDTISVVARDRRIVRWTWEKWPTVPLAFEITVPRSTHLDLLTRDGAITVGDLAGNVRVKTAKGAIFLGEIDGVVDATSLRGDVAITACKQQLTVDAKAGNVLVGRALGKTIIAGAGGSIEIQSARAEIHVVADGADLKVGFAHPLSQPSTLRASGGDIRVNLDARSGCTLDAESSRFGAIRVHDLPLKIAEGQSGGSRLLAQLNDGGPRLILRASGGSIRINGVPSLP